MAPSVHARYYDTGRQFISLDHRPNVPNIIAVLLGGSSIYRGRDECRGSDWDGAIVVSTKLEIVRLVNEQRSSLMAMLGIVQEECPELRVPDESSPDWDHFDCIRIAGFDRLQTKRSVKILSLDYFSEPRNSLRVLSFKDKRIFEAYRPPATRFYRVQQATRLEGGLFVLHDQWVYTAPFTCVHEQDASFAAFGVTADLLVSGFWVQGHDPHGLLIQKYILARYTDISALYANAQTFAKSQRFSHEYCSWLAEELSTLYKQPDMPSERPRCQCCSVKRTFLCGEAITALGQHSTKPPAQSMILSSWSRDSSTQMKTLTSPKRRELPPSPFSSNSTAAEITLPAGTLGAKATRIFCKRCQYPEQEVQGALSAATFGLYVQLPYAMPSGELWYPFFEGKTESELRLSYHHGGWSNAYAAEALLYAELVKAEDMLRLYSKCITNTQERNETWHIEDASSANRRRDNCHPGTMSGRGGTTEQPIHLFFYSRISEDPLEGERRSISLVRRAVPNRNGRVTPELPHSKSCPIIFGLGDAHGANVMIGNRVSPNNNREILYVDYEAAGFHPVMLDLAKPFYNDVFFDNLYMDIIQKDPKTAYAIEGNLINVDFAPYVNDITQAIFDVKRRFLLQPLFEMALDHGSDLEKNVPLLSNALLCCATLTRNYSKCPDAFVRNLATGIVLAQAIDLEGFYSGLKLLGLDT